MSVLLHHCQSASVLLLQQLFTAKDKQVSQAPGDDVFRGLLVILRASSACADTLLVHIHADAVSQ